MNNNIKEKDKKRSEEAIKIAMEVIPEKYHNFLYLLEQKKYYGRKDNLEDRKNPAYWGSVRSPYMGVAGRVQMAIDENIEKNFMVEWNINFDIPNLLCQAVVKTFRGVGVGTVMIKKDEKGELKIEDAETSAMGRALASLGYGVLPSGLASYEEMILYSERNKEIDKTIEEFLNSNSNSNNSSNNNNNNRNNNAPTEKQLNYINSLAQQLGMSDEDAIIDWIREEFKIHTTSLKALRKEEVSFIIEELKKYIKGGGK